jgi:replicative DNA helicase
MGGLNIVKLNDEVTSFLLQGDNNLTTGVSLPFKIMTKTFKGLRKGETMSFAMPSNSGKSRFLMNLVSYLVFVEKKKVLIISNEMTEDKMKLCLATTIINNKEIQAMHKQVLRKAEAELLTRKFRPDPEKGVEVDEDGFVIRGKDETNEDYIKRLGEVSSEFNKTVIATNWLSEQGDNAIHFVHTAEHTNQDLRNIILNYYYKEGIEYFFYDTLKTDIENIGNKEELKKTATVLSNIAQEFGVFVGSTLQLSENTTLPLNMNINDIAGSSTVKEVLDNLCLIKEINNTTYGNYEYADKEESLNYKNLEKPELLNTKYYAVVVDKNRAGAKPKLLYRLNLDFNVWEEMGYVRFKQDNIEQ